MNRYTHNSVALMSRALFLTASWLLSVNLSFSDIPWHLSASDLRFEMSVWSRPTDPAAGIIAILPDAGILPRSKFQPKVIDAKGKPLKSETLWHNPNEGLAIVFEPTDADKVAIYIQPSDEGLKFVSSFRPSLLLYVRNGNPSLENAHALANNAPVGNDIFFAVVERIFHSILPVGRDAKTSSYYTGWFTPRKPGNIYFYTTSKDGSEFFIDGKLVHSWPGRHSRLDGDYAEHGNRANITAGPHKVEYFHFNVERGLRECQLGWQFPGSTPMGNPNAPIKQRIPASPMEPSDFVHSGMTTLDKAVSKKGPLSIFSAAWESFINPYQEPVCLFRFNVMGKDSHPEQTTYEWDFGENRKVKGKNAAWLVAERSDQQVTLTVSQGKNVSRSTRIIFPKSLDPSKDPPMLSIKDAETRRQYRNVFLDMCRATPPGQSPCKSWNESMWKGLLAVLDPSADKALLMDILDRSWSDISKLPQALRWSLEDALFEALRRTDQQITVSWLNRFETEEKDTTRQTEWKARRIEFYIYDVGDLKKAEDAANRFASTASGVEAVTLAMIRRADVERFRENYNEARRLYGKAQEYLGQQRIQAKTTANAGLPLASRPGPLDRTQEAPGKTGPAPLPARQPDAAKPGQPALKTVPVEKIDDWKISAVHEAAFYATVQSQIRQGALTEAKRSLNQWEMEFPLSKLAGDYPIAEAGYHMALNNFKRAQIILMSYGKSVDLSNYLPDAMRMELECLVRMDRDDDARALAQLIIKRLPNHPLAQEAKTLLEQEGKLTLKDLNISSTSVAWTETEKVDASMLADLFGGSDNARSDDEDLVEEPENSDGDEE